MHINLDTLSAAQRYFHLIDVVVPRPIAWVSTLSETGIRNLAPFSFFSAVSSSPPCIMFSVAPKRGGVVKDTLTNIEKTEEFVVNMVPSQLTQNMVNSSLEYEANIDEFERCGILSVDSATVAPPRVAAALCALECRLFDLYPIQSDSGRLGATMILGRVQSLYLSSDGFDENGKPLESYQPVGRLGGRNYLHWGAQVALRPEND